MLLLGTRLLSGTVPVDAPEFPGDLDRAPSPSRFARRKSGTLPIPRPRFKFVRVGDVLKKGVPWGLGLSAAGGVCREFRPLGGHMHPRTRTHKDGCRRARSDSRTTCATARH